MGNTTAHEPITAEEIQRQKQIKLDRDEREKNRQLKRFYSALDSLYKDLCGKIKRGKIELDSNGRVNVQMFLKNYLFCWVTYGDIVYHRCKGSQRSEEASTYIIDVIETYCKEHCTPGISLVVQFDTYVKDYLNQKFGNTYVLDVVTTITSTYNYDMYTKITLSS